MNIELKNLKVHKDMSEETTCFFATIYLDGKKVADAKNDGHGGCNFYWWHDESAEAKLTEHAKTVFPRQTFEVLDSLIGHLMDVQEHAKWLKRQTKTKTLFRLKEDDPESWRTINVPFDERVKAHLVQKHGDDLDLIANEDVQKTAETICQRASDAIENDEAET